MYKNWVETTENVLKFLLFYLTNEEIQQKTEQENSKYILNFPTLDFLVYKNKIKEQEFQKLGYFLKKFDMHMHYPITYT